MREYFHNMWSDETRFIGLFRAVTMGVGAVALGGGFDGILDVLPDKVAHAVGPAIMSFSVMMRSSSSKSVPVAPKVVKP